MVINSNPFLDRLKEREKLYKQPIQENEEEKIDEIVNPFEERSKTFEKDRYKKESEMIWDEGSDIERGQERGIAQASSRVLESALGTPGNIQSLVKSITGLQLGTQLPTSSDLQTVSEKATKGYTKPQSDFEKQGGEVLSDITQMAMPGAASYNALRTLGIPIAGWAAKHGLEKLGTEESTASMAKTGLMFILDLASAYGSKGKGGAKNYAKELWTEGEKNIPKGVSIKATDLENSLNAVKKQLQKGGSSPDTSHALTKIEEILGKIKNGKIPVDELVAFRKNINKLIENGGGFDFSTSSNTRRGSINNLNQVKDKVIDTLDEYGKINPAFGKPYKEANEAYAAYHASNTASKFLRKYFGDYIKSPLFHGIFGSKVATATGGAIAGAALPYQGYKLIHRSMNSPGLRDLYGNVVKAALTNDAPAVAKNLEAMKKELEKEEATSKAKK